MARAFKFLKRTSLSCGAPGEGTGVTEADNGGVVLTGDALAEAPLAGAAGSGVSSCAARIEATQIESSKMQNESRKVLDMTRDNADFCVGGQAHHLAN